MLLYDNSNRLNDYPAIFQMLNFENLSHMSHKSNPRNPYENFVDQDSFVAPLVVEGISPYLLKIFSESVLIQFVHIKVG